MNKSIEFDYHTYFKEMGTNYRIIQDDKTEDVLYLVKNGMHFATMSIAHLFRMVEDEKRK